MLSSDRNIDTLTQLFEAVKHYLGLQAEYAKVIVIEKAIRLLSAAALTVILFLMFLAVLLFLSMSVANWLSTLIGYTWAMLVMAGAYALLMLMVYCFRKSLIEKPIVRFLARLLLEDNK